MSGLVPHKRRLTIVTPTAAKHTARAKVPGMPKPTSYPESAFAALEEVALVAAVIGMVALEVGLAVIDFKPDGLAGAPVADS
jgi:hypothetical protein